MRCEIEYTLTKQEQDILFTALHVMGKLNIASHADLDNLFLGKKGKFFLTIGYYVD